MRLAAGAASLPLTPPLGVDTMGYLRRWEPAAGYGEPLEVNALVLDDGERRVCIVAWDNIGTPGEYGRRFRAAVAAAAGCDPAAVLVNSSHTHAAPPPPDMLKIGGTTHDLRPEEAAFAEQAIGLAASAASLAAARLRPALVAAARTRVVGLGVNRRQRTEGETILGWNPEGALDDEVSVLRVDAEGGEPIATVVAYGCHPVVIGWDVNELSSDFVGPLRRRVREWTGGDCLYLQGCAGNVLPLEAFFDRVGPERDFGERLALAALAARDRADARAREPRQQPTRSAVPIAIWRREPAGEPPQARVDFAEEQVDLPLLEPERPLAELRRELEERARELEAAGEPRSAWNPVWIHAEWARRQEARGPQAARRAPVQALRIGHVGIVGWPGETFTELGLELKQRAPAPFPIALGYTNDLVGYLPTAEEYPYGGYEPALSQRHFGNPAPFAPEAGRLCVERGIALLERLFEGE